WPTFKNPHLEAAALAATSKDPLLFLNAALDAKTPASVAGMVSQLARQVANRNDADSARALVVTLAGKPAAADALKVAALQALAANLKSDVKPPADDTLGEALKKLLASDQTTGAVLPLIARWNFTAQVGDAAKAAVSKAAARLADKSLSDEERGQTMANL